MKIKTNKKNKKIKTNKKNKTNKTNASKRNNTRKTNRANKGRTYKKGGQVAPRVRGVPLNTNPEPQAREAQLKSRGATYPARQGKQTRAPRKPYVGLIPTQQLLGMVNWLKKSTESSICGEVSKLIPAFQNAPGVPVKLPEPVATMADGAKHYIIGSESYFIKTPEEAAPLINRLHAESATIWSERNRITCAALLLLGMISSWLQKTRNAFTIVAKGGLGVALAITQLLDGTELVSVGDLDFKVVKNSQFRGEYDQIEGMHLALYICNLIEWVLQQIVSDGYRISVLDPTTRRRVVGYQDIVKVSLRAPNGMLYSFLDMDFGDYAENRKYFDSMRPILKSIPIGGPVRFVFQNPGVMLAEKLYYYAQYFSLREDLELSNNVYQIKSLIANNLTEVKGVAPLDGTTLPVYSYSGPFGIITYETPPYGLPERAGAEKEGPYDGVFKFKNQLLTIAECTRFLEKFKRHIYTLTNAIVAVDKTVDKTNLLAARRDVVRSRLLKIPELGSAESIPLRIRILSSLYPPDTQVAHP